MPLEIYAIVETVALMVEKSCSSEFGLFSLAGLVILIFLTISSGFLTGQSDVLRNPGPFNQLLSSRTLGAVPRVPVSDGL